MMLSMLMVLLSFWHGGDRLAVRDALSASLSTHLDDAQEGAIKAIESARGNTNVCAASTRFCIRVYEGDSRGVSGPVRDGVYGYSIAEGSWRVSDPPAAEPAKKPGAEPAKPATPPPSLDELLGIKPAPKPAPATPEGDKPKGEEPGGGAPTTPDATGDHSKVDLDRLLTAQELDGAFKQAVALMGDASKRLNDHKDPGLDTQRVQEDVIKRLDQLCDSLQKGKGQPKPKPGDGKPKDGDSKQSPPKQAGQKPGDQKQDPQKGAAGKNAALGPTLQEGALNPQLESARAAWGSLPARIREMLMQGTEDRFSSRYKALTQEYYKRLAEENNK